MNDHRLRDRFAPHFDAMTADDRGRVAAALVVQRIAAGTRMMAQGVTNDRVYFIAEGEVGIHVDCQGATLKLGSRKAGSWVGELGMVDPGPASASVEATTDVEAWVLTNEDFERLQSEQAGAAAALTELVCLDIAARLRDTDSLAFHREGERVASALHAEAPEETLLDHLKKMFGLGGR